MLQNARALLAPSASPLTLCVYVCVCMCVCVYVCFAASSICYQQQSRMQCSVIVFFFLNFKFAGNPTKALNFAIPQFGLKFNITLVQNTNYYFAINFFFFSFIFIADNVDP